MRSSSRRFRRHFSRPRLLLAAAGTLVLVRLAVSWLAPPAMSGADIRLTEGDYEVLRVVDATTLMVKPLESKLSARVGTRGIRVGLSGVEFPAGQGAPAVDTGTATAFTTRFVHGHNVYLRFDRHRIDDAGNYLAYVFVGDRLLNEELIRAGLARVSVHPGDLASMARRLRKAEQESRDQARSGWPSWSVAAGRDG